MASGLAVIDTISKLTCVAQDTELTSVGTMPHSCSLSSGVSFSSK